MSDLAKSHVRITLVHGTWGRGIFPKRNEVPKNRWFDPGSRFRVALENALSARGVLTDFIEFHWSGSNSIYVREKAAIALADSLSSIPSFEDNHFVIAHSHGGNLALRALIKIRSDAVQPFLITLATPFLEVRPLALRHAGLFLRAAFALGILFGFLTFYYILRPLYFPRPPEWVQVLELFLGFFGTALFYFYEKLMEKRRSLVVQKLSDATSLQDATRYGSRILVLRAIDDEASLAIGFGALLNRVVRRASTILLFCFGSLLFAWSTEFILNGISVFRTGEGLQPSAIWLFANSALKYWPVFLALFFLLCFSRAVYGWEMSVAPLECQVNSQSSPDSVMLSALVTLSSVQSEFRHMIYDHPLCVDSIANWVAEKLSLDRIRTK